MNNIKLYPPIKDRRVYIVEAYGHLDVWSAELDEPIGGVESRKEFAAKAKAAGWVPSTEKKCNVCHVMA